jgi:hypothetical protein
LCPFDELVGDVVGLTAFVGVGLEEIGEEENLQDDKHDKQLDQDNGPQRLSQPHIAETIIVKVEDPVPESLFIHRLISYFLQIYEIILKLPTEFPKITLSII